MEQLREETKVTARIRRRVLFSDLWCGSGWRQAGSLAARSLSLPRYVIPLQSWGQSLPTLEGFGAIEVCFCLSWEGFYGWVSRRCGKRLVPKVVVLFLHSWAWQGLAAPCLAMCRSQQCGSQVGFLACFVLQYKQDAKSHQVSKALSHRHCCFSPTKVPGVWEGVCLLERLSFDFPAGGQFAPGAKLVLLWFTFIAEPLILLI